MASLASAAVPQKGWTSLMAAAYGGRPEVARMLLDRGAAQETPNAVSRILRGAAGQSAQKRDCLPSRQIHSLVGKLSCESPECSRQQRGKSQTNHYGGTAPFLHRAAKRTASRSLSGLGRPMACWQQSSALQCMTRLLSESLLLQDDSTPLIVAARRGHAAVVRVLLEHGAAKEARNKVSPNLRQRP